MATDQVNSSPEARPAATEPVPIKAVPVRHYGRWIAAAVILLYAADLAWSVWNAKNLDRATIRHYMFAATTLRGVERTIIYTVISMIIGTVLGIFLSVLRLSNNFVLSSPSGVLFWSFLGNP